jgi:acetyl-CoA carboxylase biotin carboxylase subunit
MKAPKSKEKKRFNKIFIANRSEIACRAIRPCRELGIKTVVGYSDCDEISLHVKLADEAVRLGPSPASLSYLDIEANIKAALASGCDAVFPGYGFLAENADFAQGVEDAGLTFIGPSPRVIRLMGDKIQARKTLAQAGVPVVPGIEKVKAPREVTDFGKKAGYPLIIKAAGGGGGKGMQKVLRAEEVPEALEAARSVAQKAFGNPEVYVEKFIERGRHIEFQFLGDKFGNVIHLGERECSLQRRHQKLVEEAPSSLLTPELREKMGQVVVKAMKDIGYHTAGTLEFLVDKNKNFYGLEVNTRIQVEHTVTEMVYGFDIIRKMYHIAAGNPLTYRQKDVFVQGHAIQCRINAEDPKNDFAPSFGRVTFLRQISGPFVRTESGVYQGWKIPPFYDSLIAKICSIGKDRPTAIQRMHRALGEYKIWGIKTTVPLLKKIMGHPDFMEGNFDTAFVEKNLDYLLDYVDEEDEAFKIAKFIANISAYGENVYCK